MKNILLVWSFIIGSLIFFASQVCFADVVVIYNNTDQSIFTMSQKDDTLTPQGYTKVILKGSISDYGLTDNPVNYLYKNGKFIQNSSKINADYQTQQEAVKKAQDEQIIKAKIRTMAISQLTTDGVQLQSKDNIQAQASVKTTQPVKVQ
jgi:hypothetical protein